MSNATTSLSTRSTLTFCLGALLSVLVLFAARPAQAQVQGVSYTLSPTGENVFFESDGVLGNDGNSGLENGYLYGGQLGLGFGQYLELNAVYLLGNEFETDFTNFNEDAFALGAGEAAFLDGLAGLEPRMVDLRRYGGKLRLNLGSGFGGSQAANFVPYLTLGTGIIEFDPEGIDTNEQIYATGGLGLTFSLLSRFTVSVAGEVLAYRYNPATVLLTGSDIAAANDAAGLTGTDRVQRTDFDEQTVFNPSVSAAVQFYLGGRRPGQLSELDRAFIEQFRGGGGPEIFVEPFYGRLEFNDALNFPKDQNMAGISAGVELGPYVGLRGFYWRGTTGNDLFDEFGKEFEDIAFYGGELNLRFGSSVGRQNLTPYAIVGGGYMDVQGGFDDDIPPTANVPEDRYFAMGGGGLDFALSDNLSLFGNLRYLMMSNSDAGEVSDPDEVFGSPMYTAGLKFSFGGGQRGRSAEEILSERDQRRAEEARSEREALRGEFVEREDSVQNEVMRLKARLDSLETMRMQQAEVGMEQRADSMQRATEEEMVAIKRGVEQLEQGVTEDASAKRQRPGSNLSGETITIPVPERGEIYVRFGEDADGTTTTETTYAPPTIVQPSGQVSQAAPSSGASSAQRGALSAQQIQQIVRETVRNEIERTDSMGRSMSEAEIQQIVREAINAQLSQAEPGALGQPELNRLQNRLDRIDQRLDRLAERRAAASPEVVVEEESGERRRIVDPYGPTRIVPAAGVGGGNFLFGVRGDYSGRTADIGPVGLYFMPEIMLGVNDGLSLDVIANAVTQINVLDQSLPTDALNPYVGAGLGLTSEAGLGINLLAGTEYEVGRGAAFVEFSTMDFLDYNRFLLGYRVRF